jgi:hypothetical protein
MAAMQSAVTAQARFVKQKIERLQRRLPDLTDSALKHDTLLLLAAAQELADNLLEES